MFRDSGMCFVPTSHHTLQIVNLKGADTAEAKTWLTVVCHERSRILKGVFRKGYKALLLWMTDITYLNDYNIISGWQTFICKICSFHDTLEVLADCY